VATIDWSVRAIRDDEDIASAQRLFRSYEKWLSEPVCMAGFEEEVAGLPGAYGHPRGMLLLGFFKGEAVACAGVRPLGRPLPAGRYRLKACELKRLYVSPEARGAGIGRGLLRRALRDAHAMRYQAMVLDTLPDKMPEAVRLYEEFGFVRCEAYYDNPSPRVRFMFRRLT
jgi:ribosomal protein S18 acetylase RimI-like enzyme